MEHLLAEFAEMLRSERDIAAHSPVFSFKENSGFCHRMFSAEHNLAQSVTSNPRRSYLDNMWTIL